MLTRFANIYWSADSRTGIEQLLYQTLRSIQQLHEVRELVISYVTFYEQRDLQLTRIAVDLFPLESGFRPYVKGEKLVHQGNLSLKKLGESIRIATGYDNAEKITSDGVKRLSGYLNETVDAETTLQGGLYASYEKHIQNLLLEAQSARRLRRAIETEVMDNLNNFIRHNEPHLRRILQEFQDLLAKYENAYFETDSLRYKYDETRRQKEFYEQNKSENAAKEITPSSDVEDSIEEVPSEPPSPLEPNPLENQFKFPLRVGPVILNDIDELASLIDRLDKSLPTVKRTIPIPGYRNLIFKSEDLVDVITRGRLFEPSRVHMERFGQALIDLKLMSGTGFMTARKFKVENLWYEFSNLAFLVIEHQDHKLHPLSVNSAVGSQSMDSSINEVTLKFSGMFKNVKVNWLKGDYNEKLAELEESYRTAYLEFQDAKHILDSRFGRRANEIEGFEKLKIETIHHAFTKLAEVLYKSSEDSTKRLKEFAREFINNYEKPDIFQDDFQQLIDDFSVGIYFPSLQPIKSRLYVNAQDVKTGFNLFKDIPLQLLCSQMNSQMSITVASTPYLLYKVLRLIESKKGTEDLRALWTKSLDFQQYWFVKDELIREIGDYDPLNLGEITSELEIHKSIMMNLIELLNGKSVDELINFVRNWLLEINDTIIPCMRFELLISQIKSDSDIDEIAKSLSSLPRSNLSSLLFVLEHICRVFKLDQIEEFENFDNGEEVKASSEVDELVVSELNSMEAIGAIPFVHLIFRPTPSKNSKGFKPPLEIYNDLLSKLLNVELRCKLLKALWSHEKSYRSKKEAEKISILKALPVLAPPTTNGTVTPVKNGGTGTGTNGHSQASPSARPTSGEFSLRPFRTGTTPLPSPSSSPRVRSKLEQSGTQLSVKEDVRSRSASGTFIPPTINVLYEEDE